ncbi:FtsH protease activity modulator HflK [Treponema parvum]|uniref:Protein HflK n=1 Tax=Treponema parvum TaxID=138851 RepID=A0A975IDK3_9SPIR|nr:FtsH protease activity modulator HflK [Treponema parvum]QTQ12269.1 FtsH protease activity modulator HflK [Treponema parvum]QTQ15749.1 FtsH protease activity modulator HflK [Treponema parvum]
MAQSNVVDLKKLSNFFLKPSRILWITAALIALWAAGSCFFKVDETEQAVITRFGKYYATLGPGLQLKLPFGIDKNYNVPVKVVQTEQFGFQTINSGIRNEYKNNITDESTMLTGDLNIVDVEWIIQYRITDPRAWLFNVQDKRQTIRDISRSAINVLVGDRAILDIMGQERTAIENLATESMNQKFKDLGLGINVNAVKLQNIVPPKGVQDAFEDVNKAIQDMNRFINEGKEAYNSEIPKTQGQADQQVQIAEGYASERVNRARGDTARFNSVYSEYSRSPVITRNRLYLETMEDLFGSEDKSPSLIDKRLQNVLPVKTLTSGAGTVKSGE